jgi:hypothetical protein
MLGHAIKVAEALLRSSSNDVNIGQVEQGVSIGENQAGKDCQKSQVLEKESSLFCSASGKTWRGTRCPMCSARMLAATERQVNPTNRSDCPSIH